MKTAFAAALLIALSVPVRAQDFFGMTPDDAQAAMARAMADQRRYEAELARKRAEKAQGPGYVDRALGTYAALSASDPVCVYDAVSLHLTLRPAPSRPAPQLFLESRTIVEDFEQYVFNDTGAWPNAFYTTYLPTADAVFLDDHAALYSSERTLDDALAGQYAAAVDRRAGLDAARAKADQSAVEAWYHAVYTAGGKAVCPLR